MDPVLQRAAARVRDAYEQRHGCRVDPRALPYVDHWLRSPDHRLPLPDLRHWYREPGLWLPLSCAYLAIFDQAEDLGLTNGTTTAAKDTSGCDLLTISYRGPTSAVSTVTDNKSNTWANIISINVGGVFYSMWYAKNPTVGSGHTVTQSGSGNFPLVHFWGFSGSNTTAPLDQFSSIAQFGGSDIVNPGPVTPSENNELIFTSLGRNGGAASDTIFGGNPFTFGSQNVVVLWSAYRVQTTAGAENPNWFAGSNQYVNDSVNAGIATFKAAGGGGGTRGLFQTPPLAGLGIGGSFFRDPLQGSAA